MNLRHLIASSIGLLAYCLPSSALAQTTQELKRMSLPDLLKIEVTTVSRTPEATTTVPAAVFVITQEDIKRSGATSIPEALRLAPGVQVARIDAGVWSIGIRGFADRLSRSMLVLIDGRAVYSPLFAGTYWETQDTLLADIDRIEVIRGPGGTLWGSNAVNGIIKIITKAVKETQGLLVIGGGGSEDRAFAAIRYGATRGAASVRAYFKAFDRVSEFHPDGNDYDGWRAGQAGFRADWALRDKRSVTVQGDIYDGRLGERATLTSYTPPFSQSLNVDAPIAGGNVLARFSGRAGANADFQVQTYYDRTSRDEIPVAESRDTFDVDFQETWRGWPRNVVAWGAGYRVTSGRITAIATSVFDPPRRTDNLFSAFVQDEFTLVPSKWRVTIGSKVEHNDYSAFEIQPTARVLWTPGRSTAAWGAITCAVRTPSRVETDFTTASLVSASPTLTFVRLLPNPDFQPENLVAYEVGYRARLLPRLYITVSGFYNDLNDTLSTDLQPAVAEIPAAPAPTRLILPVDLGNGIQGHSHGVEVTADARPAPWWRVTANYAFLDVDVSKVPGGLDLAQERTYEGLAPHHQVQLGSSFDVAQGWSIDWFLRYVSDLPAGPVPGYSASDVRIARQLSPPLEVSVVGQDLFADHHLEWTSVGKVEINRSVYARVTCRSR